MALNPYHPPVQQDSTRSHRRGGAALQHLVPPVIAAGITLLLWVAIVQLLDRPSSKRMEMGLWAGSLLLSLVVATAMVAWRWRPKPSPLAFAFVFAIFAGAFCVLEGDVSNGTDRTQMLTVYGTMLALPPVAGTVCWLVRSRVKAAAKESEG